MIGSGNALINQLLLSAINVNLSMSNLDIYVYYHNFIYIQALIFCLIGTKYTGI